MALWMLNQAQLLVLIAVAVCTSATAYAGITNTYVRPSYLPEPMPEPAVSNSVLLRRLARSLDPDNHYGQQESVGSSYASESLGDDLDRARAAVQLMGARPDSDPNPYESLSMNYMILLDILASRKHSWPGLVVQRPDSQYPEFHPVTSSYSHADLDNVASHSRPSSGHGIKSYPWDPAQDYLDSEYVQSESDNLIDLNAAFLDQLKESMAAGNAVNVDLPDVFTLDPKTSPKPRVTEPVTDAPVLVAPDCFQSAVSVTPPARVESVIDNPKEFKGYTRPYSKLQNNELKHLHSGYPEEDIIVHKMTAKSSKVSLQPKERSDSAQKKTQEIPDYASKGEKGLKNLHKMMHEYLESLDTVPVLPLYQETTTPLPPSTLKAKPVLKLN